MESTLGGKKSAVQSEGRPLKKNKNVHMGLTLGYIL